MCLLDRQHNNLSPLTASEKLHTHIVMTCFFFIFTTLYIVDTYIYIYIYMGTYTFAHIFGGIKYISNTYGIMQQRKKNS